MTRQQREVNFAYFYYYYFSPPSGTVALRMVEADVG
jgi:hypothetical protein